MRADIELTVMAARGMSCQQRGLAHVCKGLRPYPAVLPLYGAVSQQCYLGIRMTCLFVLNAEVIRACLVFRRTLAGCRLLRPPFVKKEVEGPSELVMAASHVQRFVDRLPVDQAASRSPVNSHVHFRSFCLVATTHERTSQVTRKNETASTPLQEKNLVH